MIKDYEDRMPITDKLLLVNLTQSLAKTGSEYLRLDFRDASGTISAFIFDNLSEFCDLGVGKVYVVDGFVKKYKDSLSLVVSQVDETSEDPRNYQFEADLDFTSMQNTIEHSIMSLQSTELQTLTLSVYQKYKERFINYPAAKQVHHNFQGGLLYHTFSMLSTANALLSLRPHLNADVIRAAIILHDLGKCVELTGDLITEYTNAGKLVGHISILDGELYLLAHELNYDINNGELLHLRHILLSHHGKEEWGSPIKPQTAEALFVHMIDQFDATMQIVAQATCMPNSSWTEKLWALDNRQLFKFENGR